MGRRLWLSVLSRIRSAGQQTARLMRGVRCKRASSGSLLSMAGSHRKASLSGSQNHCVLAPPNALVPKSGTTVEISPDQLQSCFAEFHIKQAKAPLFDPFPHFECTIYGAKSPA
jgi:hypothetical protein